MNVTVAVAVMMCAQTLSATSYLTTGHIPTAGEASNGGKDCWQWVKVTDRSHFTSTAIPNHRAPVLCTNTFSFTLVSSPWFPLPSSPHLNSPSITPASPSQLRPIAQQSRAKAHVEEQLFTATMCKCSWMFKHKDTRSNVLLIFHDQCLLFLLCFKSSVRYTH